MVAAPAARPRRRRPESACLFSDWHACLIRAMANGVLLAVLLVVASQLG